MDDSTMSTNPLCTQLADDIGYVQRLIDDHLCSNPWEPGEAERELEAIRDKMQLVHRTLCPQEGGGDSAAQRAG